ncbi:MAG: hypothetical protein ACE5JL_12885 [Dehalococcoidia bacterium]
MGLGSRKLFFIGGLVLVTLVIALACGGGTEPQTREFDLEISEGKLVMDTPVIKVNQDDEVILNIKADEAAEFHIHVYDLAVVTDPDEVVQLRFVANAEGGFPITIHSLDSHDEHSHDEEEGHTEDEGGEEGEIVIGSLEVHPR